MTDIVEKEKHYILENNCTRIGGGGTKTALLLKEDNKTVVLIPNAVDGQMLINVWDTVIADELAMYKEISDCGIPSLALTRCTVNDEVFNTLSCPSFESYTKDGAYVLDLKNAWTSNQWPKNQKIIEKDPYIWQNWIDVCFPAVVDLYTLSRQGIVLASDSVNVVLVKPGHRWHTGNLHTPIQARLFCFDFATKYRSSDHQRIYNNAFPFHQMSRITEAVVWEHFAPFAISLPEKEKNVHEALTMYFAKMFQGQ